MYALIRPLLFLLPPECAHHLLLRLLTLCYSASYVRQLQTQLPKKQVSLFGLNFPNPIGLAAGLDKNGECIDALFGLGFGFIEVGAVTPKPQLGNPKPRLFRLLKARGLINRMGFNNRGVDYLVEQLKKRKVPGIVGVNLGKNKSTPLALAHLDYEYCFEKVYPYVDYVSINISSPNTPDLCALQSEVYLADLLSRVLRLREQLSLVYRKVVPILVKISPDLTMHDLQRMSTVFRELKIEGIIAVNTTCDRSSVSGLVQAHEAGGLSGQPLFDKMISVVSQFHKQTRGEIPIIAVGGIASSSQIHAALNAGASLVQLYTGLIYQGPSLIKKMLKSL